MPKMNENDDLVLCPDCGKRHLTPQQVALLNLFRDLQDSIIEVMQGTIVANIQQTRFSKEELDALWPSSVDSS